jgi:hypothetical protein
MTSPDGDRAGYATPAALRRALADRLRVHARPHGPFSLQDLQRQYAYDRLLARLYVVGDGWILKGATALLARGIAVRHTVDIDLYRRVGVDRAERDLRVAAAHDLGDWFAFELGTGRPTVGFTAVRWPVVARIGASPWTRFHVDVVGDLRELTGVPDPVPALTPVELPGLIRPGYQAYPIVDHIADKICAMYEVHGRLRRPSTRYKDLVDLVALVRHATVRAEPQRRALAAEIERRGLAWPERFDVPDRRLWLRGFGAELRRAPGIDVTDLDDALARVRPFAQPLIEGTATGVWVPESGRWEVER